MFETPIFFLQFCKIKLFVTLSFNFGLMFTLNNVTYQSSNHLVLCQQKESHDMMKMPITYMAM